MGLLTSQISPASTIPQIGSKAEEWIEWHKALKSSFGTKVANQLWIKAWSKRGSNAANTHNLRDYMQSQGIKLSDTTWDKFVDVGYGITGTFSDIFHAGEYLTIGLGIVIVAGLGFIIYNVGKKPTTIVQGAKLAAL